MSFHDELDARLANKPAVYIGEQVLAGLALNSLQKTISRLLAKPFQLTETKPFSVNLTSAGTVGNPASGKVPAVDLVEKNNEILLATSGGMKLTVEIGNEVGGAFTDVFATVTMLVQDLEFVVDVTPGSVIVLPATAKFIPTISYVPDEELEALAVKYGVDVPELHRIVGMVAYSGIQTVISVELNRPHSIMLGVLFPGVILSGSLKTFITKEEIERGPALVIQPTGGMHPIPGSICECGAEDGMGEFVPGQLKPDPAAPAGQPDGEITLGGITKADPNSIKDYKYVKSGLGDTGIYLPRSSADIIAQGPYPAVRVDFGGGGFINYSGFGIVDFLPKVDVDFDIANLAIRVVLRFRIECFGKIRVDLGKLGNPKIGTFEATQPGAGADYIRILIKPAVKDGVVYLKPYVDDLGVAPFKVNVNFFKVIGSPFGSKGALIGFIFDEILARVVAHNLPIILRKKIHEYMAKTQWKLIDLPEWMRLTALNPKLTWQDLGAHVSVKASSMIVSTNRG